MFYLPQKMSLYIIEYRLYTNEFIKLYLHAESDNLSNDNKQDNFNQLEELSTFRN